jgi:hypothetical protein
MSGRVAGASGRPLPYADRLTRRADSGSEVRVYSWNGAGKLRGPVRVGKSIASKSCESAGDI